MSDWEESEPVGDELCAIVRVTNDNSRLELDNFSNRCDGVVTSVVIHLELFLLSLDLWSDSEVDSSLQRGQALV